MSTKASALSPNDIQARRDAFYQELRQDMAKQCPRYDPLATHACFNIAQLYSRIEVLLAEEAKPTGVTLAGLNALIVLNKHGDAGCALNILSDLLVVSRANITGLVDSLVRKQLMTRTEDPKDRRVIIARITKKGRNLLASYMPKHYGRMCKLMESLTKEEKETLIRILNKARGNLVHLGKD